MKAFVGMIKDSKFLVFLYGVLTVAAAIIPSLQILAIAYFVDCSLGIYNHTLDIRSIHLALALVALCLVASFVINEAINYLKIRLYHDLNRSIQDVIITKRSKLKYGLLESEKTWKMISIVEKDPAQNVLDTIVNSFELVSRVVKIVGFISIITIYIWWVGISILLISIPTIYLAYKSAKVEYDTFEKAEDIGRGSDYLQEVLTTRAYVDERKLFQFRHAISEIWGAKYNDMRQVTYEAYKQFYVKLGVANGLTKILILCIGILLLVPLKQIIITVGLFMSLLANSMALFTGLSTELASQIEKLIKNILFVQTFYAFNNLEEESIDEDKGSISLSRDFGRIEFKNVSFSYPNAERKILDNLNVVFESGKKYALVGENGSGKSTMVKLLLGLYDNYEGKIMIQGRDIKDINRRELSKFHQVVFQDFSRYEMTLREFLTFGKNSNDVIDEDKQMITALEQVGLEDMVRRLEKGLDTHLGRVIEEGCDLSGGEWQRLAIARTLVLKKPFTVLDEPTSAIDPISESKLYQLFEEAMQLDSSLIITHRLGAARIAEEILVLKAGKIIEQGSHKVLLEQGGLYSKMFSLQKGWYDEKAEV